MATSVAASVSPSPAAPAARWDSLSLNWSRAPLVPIAVAGTVGIVIDRYAEMPLHFAIAAGCAFLLAWIGTLLGRERPLGLIYLWASIAAGAAAYHHWHCNILSTDDIAHLADAERRPLWLRGVLQGNPRIVEKQEDPLSAFPESASTRLVLRVSGFKDKQEWRRCSGLVQVVAEGELNGLRAGDLIEAVGQLSVPEPPSNPGEFDYARRLRDQRIYAVLQVRNTTAAVVRLDPRSAGMHTWLASVRAWAADVLQRHLPQRQQGLGRALLLGDDAAMTEMQWERYITTGSVHVLAISGLHLAVLSGFVWFVLRLAQLRRRAGAVCVAMFALGYALLVGGRPPVLRAAGMVTALCGGLLCQRPVLPANSFALAWIVIALVNPTAVFNTGCQFSFLAVAVLIWGMARWQRNTDPLHRLVDSSRPHWQRLLFAAFRLVAVAYIVNAAVWFAVMPLVAWRHHLVSPIALLVGPPMILLSSVALLAGFLLLLGGHLFWPLSVVLVQVTGWSLALSEQLVSQSMKIPYAYFYVPDLPDWLLATYYIGLAAVLIAGGEGLRWRWLVLGGAFWFGAAAVWGVPRDRPFRCTFVAVGHGGCIVLETKTKTIVYDAGAITGPDVTRRKIAPFLWTRGVTVIDELFLSHADLDHFNGVPALLDRFRVRRVNLTPSFSERETPAARTVLDGLHARQIPIRILSAGAQLHIGDLTIDVLHPPMAGPAGSENARSLVLLCRTAKHSLLLTGDLEAEGMNYLLARPSRPVDVLMAPHHGSKTANTPQLARWAKPRIVVSCQGRPWRSAKVVEPYSQFGAEYLSTWPHGAITISERGDALLVESFRTKLVKMTR